MACILSPNTDMKVPAALTGSQISSRYGRRILAEGICLIRSFLSVQFSSWFMFVQ